MASREGGNLEASTTGSGVDIPRRTRTSSPVCDMHSTEVEIGPGRTGIAFALDGVGLDLEDFLDGGHDPG